MLDSNITGRGPCPNCGYCPHCGRDGHGKHGLRPRWSSNIDTSTSSSNDSFQIDGHDYTPDELADLFSESE